jgi:tetratricopeptide (TPR) repeat protein
MHLLKINYLIVFVLLIAFSACEIELSNEKAPEVPLMDEAYYKKSIDYLKKVMEEDSSNPDVYYKIAKMYYNIGEFKNALWYIHEAVKRDEINYHYLVLYTGISLELKDYKTASSLALKAEAMDFRHTDLYQYMAQLAIIDNNFLRASDYLNRVLIFNPENYAIHYLKGKVLLAMEDTLAAEESFIKSLEVNPDNRLAYDDIMDIYVQTKQYQKAKTFVSDYSGRLEGKDANALLKEAIIFKSTGNIELAKAMLKGLVLQDSLFQQAYEELASLFEKENKLDSTEYYLKRILSIKEDDHEVRVVLAKLYDKTKRYYLAKSEYEKILEFDPEHNLALEELEKVNGKVAYLHRIDQQKQRRPEIVPVIPKKNIDN